MSKRADVDREKRWRRKLLVDQQARARADREMAEYNRMVERMDNVFDALIPKPWERT